MFKAFFSFVALLLLAGTALAQGQPQPSAIEPGTKLGFGQSVGGATLVRSANSSGASLYLYQAPNGMEITVDVYDNGRRIPNGSSHPVIVNQFNDDLNAIAQQASAAGLKGFEKPSVPSACTYGQYTLRCIVFSVAGTSATGRYYGKYLLIGYREHFVKIIVRWSQISGQTAADADKVLSAFVPALLVR